MYSKPKLWQVQDAIHTSGSILATVIGGLVLADVFDKIDLFGFIIFNLFGVLT